MEIIDLLLEVGLIQALVGGVIGFVIGRLVRKFKSK